jgi:hypothetical protein
VRWKKRKGKEEKRDKRKRNKKKGKGKERKKERQRKNVFVENFREYGQHFLRLYVFLHLTNANQKSNVIWKKRKGKEEKRDKRKEKECDQRIRLYVFYETRPDKRDNHLLGPARHNYGIERGREDIG